MMSEIERADLPPSGRPGYAVGDQICLPPEPPVGSEIESEDGMGRFRLRRGEDGWYMPGSPRRFGWNTVVREWLPATIITVGETKADAEADRG